MVIQIRQSVEEAKAEIFELTGEHVEDLGLTDEQIMSMLENGF